MQINVHRERHNKLRQEAARYNLTVERFREGFAFYRGAKRITRQLSLTQCAKWLKDQNPWSPAYTNRPYPPEAFGDLD